MTTPDKTNLRKANSGLYWLLMVNALGFFALGLNFLLTVPTFEQFDIPKNVIGWGFLGIGSVQLVLLNVVRRLRLVRLMLLVGVFYTITWGIGTTQTFFEGKSSLQLFTLYLYVAAVQTVLRFEPSRTTATGNGG